MTPPEELPYRAENGPRSISTRAAESRLNCDTCPCPSGPVGRDAILVDAHAADAERGVGADAADGDLLILGVVVAIAREQPRHGAMSSARFTPRAASRSCSPGRSDRGGHVEGGRGDPGRGHGDGGEFLGRTAAATHNIAHPRNGAVRAHTALTADALSAGASGQAAAGSRASRHADLTLSRVASLASPPPRAGRGAVRSGESGCGRGP